MRSVFTGKLALLLPVSFDPADIAGIGPTIDPLEEVVTEKL